MTKTISEAEVLSSNESNNTPIGTRTQHLRFDVAASVLCGAAWGALTTLISGSALAGVILCVIAYAACMLSLMFIQAATA